MRTIRIADGTIVWRYLEESGKGRVVVTLVQIGGDLYFAHREWWSDVNGADDAFHSATNIDVKVAWIRNEQKDRGEVLPDGTLKNQEG